MSSKNLCAVCKRTKCSFTVCLTNIALLLHRIVFYNKPQIPSVYFEKTKNLCCKNLIVHCVEKYNTVV